MPSLKIRSDCVYIGIDPGQDGGLALLGGSKPRCGVGGRYLPPCRVELTSMPPTERDIWDWIFAKSDPPEGTIFAMIEKVHSMPKQGIASTFKFGVGYGGLRMALTAVRIPFEEVSPQAWQKALGIPVMAVGRINDPLIADEIIEKGKADLICVGRGLLADPEMPNKAKEGRLDDIRICIACNTCMESIFRKGRVECLVNPALGREKEMAFYPTRNPRKVMVIGGGPGGLNVAWVAARRGHDVHLFEKQSTLGGQLLLGSVTGYKKELRSLIKYQKRQVEKFGVKCYLNREVNVNTVMEENPDVVIVATGSLPSLPPIEGLDKDIVIPFAEVLNGGLPAQKKTVVIGGGPTGCEVAHHLSQNGCQVTIVEMLPEIGKPLESITKKVLLNQLRANQVEMLTEFRLSRVEDNGVVVTGKDGKERFIEAGRVIITIGNRPDSRLYDQITTLGYETHQIGDCLEPRSAKAAIYEGAVLGRAI